MIRALAALAVLASGSLAVLPAQAQDAAAYLAATCSNCHGTDGRPAGSGMPGLAGLAPAYFAEQMNEFREGKRPATVMHQIAKGYTDQQIALMASFFARQKNK